MQLTLKWRGLRRYLILRGILTLALTSLAGLRARAAGLTIEDIRHVTHRDTNYHPAISYDGNYVMYVGYGTGYGNSCPQVYRVDLRSPDEDATLITNGFGIAGSASFRGRSLDSIVLMVPMNLCCYKFRPFNDVKSFRPCCILTMDELGAYENETAFHFLQNLRAVFVLKNRHGNTLTDFPYRNMFAEQKPDFCQFTALTVTADGQTVFAAGLTRTKTNAPLRHYVVKFAVDHMNRSVSQFLRLIPLDHEIFRPYNMFTVGDYDAERQLILLTAFPNNTLQLLNYTSNVVEGAELFLLREGDGSARQLGGPLCAQCYGRAFPQFLRHAGGKDLRVLFTEFRGSLSAEGSSLRLLNVDDDEISTVELSGMLERRFVMMASMSMGSNHVVFAASDQPPYTSDSQIFIGRIADTVGEPTKQVDSASEVCNSSSAGGETSDTKPNDGHNDGDPLLFPGEEKFFRNVRQLTFSGLHYRAMFRNTQEMCLAFSANDSSILFEADGGDYCNVNCRQVYQLRLHYDNGTSTRSLRPAAMPRRVSFGIGSSAMAGQSVPPSHKPGEFFLASSYRGCGSGLLPVLFGTLPRAHFKDRYATIETFYCSRNAISLNRVGSFVRDELEFEYVVMQIDALRAPYSGLIAYTLRDYTSRQNIHVMDLESQASRPMTYGYGLQAGLSISTSGRQAVFYGIYEPQGCTRVEFENYCTFSVVLDRSAIYLVDLTGLPPKNTSEFWTDTRMHSWYMRQLTGLSGQWTDLKQDPVENLTRANMFPYFVDDWNVLFTSHHLRSRRIVTKRNASVHRLVTDLYLIDSGRFSIVKVSHNPEPGHYDGRAVLNEAGDKILFTSTRNSTAGDPNVELNLFIADWVYPRNCRLKSLRHQPAPKPSPYHMVDLPSVVGLLIVYVHLFLIVVLAKHLYRAFVQFYNE